jgi:hypothetical protein
MLLKIYQLFTSTKIIFLRYSFIKSHNPFIFNTFRHFKVLSKTETAKIVFTLLKMYQHFFMQKTDCKRMFVTGCGKKSGQ